MSQQEVSKRWEFDAAVTQVFDDILVRSIPQYEVMRQAVTALGRKFIIQKSTVLDLGSARGLTIDPLLEEFGATCRWILTETSKPMLEALEQKYEGWIKTGYVDVRDCDLTQGVPHCIASLVLSVLTVQFTPIEFRQAIIQAVYNRLHQGGAFIFVEKILGANARLDEIMVERYLTLKTDVGYSQDEIERKRLQLRGVLVPVTAKWNVDLLEQAGFRQVDCFWRWMNFAGWIGVK